MLARPVVGVYNGTNSRKGGKLETTKLPSVFTTPIRPDLIHDVFRNVSCNRKQAWAVSVYAGKQNSAESWGTGRAVARIPRVAGGGTHRAGQGAFGNMCRGGRMFAPAKVWRRWHRKTNLTARRYAIASAVAASAIPSLVMARGHRVNGVPEIPLVVDNKVVDNIVKTKAAVAMLKQLGAYEDVEKVKNSKSLRAGKGKYRNRRWRHRRGPLIVYHEKSPMNKSFRNIPGVELVSVNALNILQLAPGGHVGRFVIWTRDAFNQLDNIFGTVSKQSKVKKGFKVPRHIMANPNLARIINSEEIQSVLRPKLPVIKRERKVNPLTHPRVMEKLNPGSMEKRRVTILAQKAHTKARTAALAQGKKYTSPTAIAAKKTRAANLKKLRTQRQTYKQTIYAK